MFINGINFTVGADPEVFVKKDGWIQSAHGLVKGTKLQPDPVLNGAVQVDGMALEFNIDPADNAEQFQSHLESVQAQLAEMIGDFEFTNEVSNVFDEEYMKLQPLEAIMLGCNADYNGYTLTENPKPDEAGMMRTVGGHIHIGGIETKHPFKASHFNLMGKLARFMDEKVGVYSILWDKDDLRRSMYGLAGSFRPKNYGMEYRTLSNAWIFNKEITSFIFEGVRESIESMFEGVEPNPEVREIIDCSQREHNFFKNNRKADMIKEIVGV